MDLWENKPVQERQLQIKGQDYIKINQESRKKLKKKKRRRWDCIQKEEILGKKQGENQSPFFYFHWFCIGLIVLSLLNSGEVCISKIIVKSSYIYHYSIMMFFRLSKREDVLWAYICKLNEIIPFHSK